METRGRKPRALEALKKQLKPGRVYRRRDLVHLSTNLDRHLKRLVDDGFLRKLSGGLYERPRSTEFGDAPADQGVLVGKFLRTDQFVLLSFNSFNALGLGTTQLYRNQVVLNQKRHGELKLGNRTFEFLRRANVPRKMTREVLLVEMLNSLGRLAEDPNRVMKNLKKKLSSFDEKGLLKAGRLYGNYSTQKKLSELLGVALVA